MEFHVHFKKENKKKKRGGEKKKERSISERGGVPTLRGYTNGNPESNHITEKNVDHKESEKGKNRYSASTEKRREKIYFENTFTNTTHTQLC